MYTLRRKRAAMYLLSDPGGGLAGLPRRLAGSSQLDPTPPLSWRGRSSSGVKTFEFLATAMPNRKTSQKKPQGSPGASIYFRQRVWAGSSLLVGGIGSPFS